MNKETIYFAYGSNLDLDAMAYRCPKATPIGRAQLVDWQFRINQHGLATAIPSAGSTVWGGLWLVTPRCEQALDAYESIATGLYVRRTLRVKCNEGAVEALVYLATNQTLGVPRTAYLDCIVAGARSFEFPEEYLRELECGGSNRSN